MPTFTAMSKARLDFDFDYDFLLYGISCHLKDYRLCWSLNHQLGSDLQKQNDYELTVKTGEAPLRFSFYTWEDAVNHLKYIVVANRGNPGILVQEQRQADYFLLVEGLTDLVDTQGLLDRIKGTDVVLTAYSIDPNQLKSKQNLLFE